MAAVLVRFPVLAVQRAFFLCKTPRALPKSNKVTFHRNTRCVSTISSKRKVNGVEIHYEVAGQGSDVILCMPGALGSTQSDFGPQLKGLSDEFTVIAFDPQGYGKSIPPKRDFPADFFARDADDAAGLMNDLSKCTTVVNNLRHIRRFYTPNAAILITSENRQRISALLLWTHLPTFRHSVHSK